MKIRLTIWLFFATIPLLACELLGLWSADTTNPKSVFQVVGAAMEPSFDHGDLVEIDEVSASDLIRGDVIVFELEGRTYLKRIVGLPKEIVEIRDGIVFINNEPLDEPYATPLATSNLGARTLGPNEFFVLGDNRGNSSDSRSYGPISRDQILGRVVREP